MPFFSKSNNSAPTYNDPFTPIGYMWEYAYDSDLEDDPKKGTVPKAQPKVAEIKKPLAANQVPNQNPQGMMQVPNQNSQGMMQVPNQYPQGMMQVPNQYSQGMMQVPNQYWVYDFDTQLMFT